MTANKVIVYILDYLKVRASAYSFSFCFFYKNPNANEFIVKFSNDYEESGFKVLRRKKFFFVNNIPINYFMNIESRLKLEGVVLRDDKNEYVVRFETNSIISDSDDFFKINNYRFGSMIANKLILNELNSNKNKVLASQSRSLLYKYGIFAHIVESERVVWLDTRTGKEFIIRGVSSGVLLYRDFNGRFFNKGVSGSISPLTFLNDYNTGVVIKKSSAKDL